MVRMASVLLVGVLALCGCAMPTVQQVEAWHMHSRRDLITEDQIFASGQRNLYELIRSLRPSWIRRWGGSTEQGASGAQVYLDEAPVGGLDALHGIAVESVVYLRRYDAIDAASRWGIGHEGGVILVSTRPLAR